MTLVVDDDDDDELPSSFDLPCPLDSMTRDNHLDTSSSLDFEIETFERRIRRYLIRQENAFRSTNVCSIG
jgi:hypothetical protein